MLSTSDQETVIVKTYCETDGSFYSTTCDLVPGWWEASRCWGGEGKSIAKTNDREDHIMETLRAAATQGRLFLQTHTLQINNLVSVATKNKQECKSVII